MNLTHERFCVIAVLYIFTLPLKIGCNKISVNHICKIELPKNDKYLSVLKILYFCHL